MPAKKKRRRKSSGAGEMLTTEEFHAYAGPLRERGSKRKISRGTFCLPAGHKNIET